MEKVDYNKVLKLAKVEEGEQKHIITLGIGTAGTGGLSREGTSETRSQDL